MGRPDDRNIKGSLFTYFAANFTACSIEWPGVEFRKDAVTEWVTPWVLGNIAPPYRKAQNGAITTLLQVNVHVKYGANAYRLDALTKLVVSAMEHKVVPLKEQDSAFALIGYANVGEAVTRILGARMETGVNMLEAAVTFKVRVELL